MYSLKCSTFTNRLLLSECDISVERFRGGELSEDEVLKMHRAAGVIEKLPVYIDDKPSVTITSSVITPGSCTSVGSAG